ncbi:MAG: LptF/LptG family permease [Chthoniobacterales bacterium]|nr:LptF/LptG family permease [Chthoniobacterales bacterium]
MHLIDRYVGRATFVTALYGVFVLSVVLVLGNLFKEALDLLINRDVPLGYILFFMACVIPFSLTFTVPWAFLTSVLLVFGRMSADNETVALRACGISLLRASLPVLAIGLLLSGFCFWINTAVAPAAELAMRQSLADMARSNPLALFTPNEVVDQFRGRKIFVGSREGDELRAITIIEQNDSAQVKTVIRARRGVINRGENGEQLDLTLHDAMVESRPAGHEDEPSAIRHGVFASEVDLDIPLDDLVQTSLLWRPLRTFQMGELFAFLDQDLESGDRPTRAGVRTEISKRFSLSVASLAFAFIAIPLGIVAQRRETSAGFAISLAVAFGYFFFVALADMLREDAAAYPYLLLWIPNFLFISIGSWLLLRLDHR